MLALGQGGMEGNPIANYFISHDALHYFKLVGVGLLCFYLIYVAKKNSKNQPSVIRVLLWTNLGFGFIVVSNVVMYFIQKYDFALR